MEGSGKGRIEIIGNHYTFQYESQINKKTNYFDLAMAFPIIGEKKVSLSLNPKIAAKEIGRSNVLKMIEEKIGDRYNKKQIVDAMEEFFVLTSEFLSYRSKEKFPPSYKARLENDHFFMQRPHAQFRFEVEGFAEEKGYFKRVLVKIYPKEQDAAQPLFSLFLVPETCDR